MTEMRLREGNGRDEGDGVIEKARGSAERRWRGEKDEKWALRDESENNDIQTPMKRENQGNQSRANKNEILEKPKRRKKGMGIWWRWNFEWNRWDLIKLSPSRTTISTPESGTCTRDGVGRYRWSVFGRSGSSNGFTVDNDGGVGVLNHRDS